MRGFRRCCAYAAVFLAACATAAAARAADVSDLWWNPEESGWGMQLVRGGDATFATLFVYDVVSRPTFYTATLSAVAGAWSGTLVATTGPFFAAPTYVPGSVDVREVGTLTFRPLTADRAELRYVVDAAVITKVVQRQTLRNENQSGRFDVTVRRESTHCPDAAANRDETVPERLAVDHRGTTIALEWSGAQRTCSHVGAYQQSGRVGAVQAAYACSDGENGDFTFFEIERRDSFLTGRFQGHSVSHGCDYRGSFAGLLAQ